MIELLAYTLILIGVSMLAAYYTTPGPIWRGEEPFCL